MRHTRLLILALGLALATAGQAKADLFSLDSRASYLYTPIWDTFPGTRIIDLSTLSFSVVAGDKLKITEVGSISNSTGGTFKYTWTGAVFSSTNTLLPGGGAEDRVPDAIAPTSVSPGYQFPFVTTDHADGNPTDIPQDFQVAFYNGTNNGVTVEVPVGAKFLFVSAYDSYYGDNTDPNHDYGVILTPSGVPEPATLGLVIISAFGLIGYAGLRRRGFRSA